MDEIEIEHLNGTGVVARYWYIRLGESGAARVSAGLPSKAALELWSPAALTHGDVLTKIELVWDPSAAAELREIEASNTDATKK